MGAVFLGLVATYCRNRGNRWHTDGACFHRDACGLCYVREPLALIMRVSFSTSFLSAISNSSAKFEYTLLGLRVSEM